MRIKTNYKLALALLAGVAIAIAAGAIRAQQVNSPPGYVIAEVEVTDPPTMQKYVQKIAETLAPFNGHYRYLVRSSKGQALEGEPPKGIVVIAFDSAEQARDWYNSPAYQAIKPIRQSAAKSRIFIVEGVIPK